MGMAVQDSLHLKSLLQEMPLSQLAKPFELTVYTDSSSGQALASKLGLTRKSKHVQLRYMFIRDLLANGQLQLSKIPAGKNPAAMLTKHLTASNLHKLLSKLGVRTRAADSKDLLSVLNLEVLASTREQQSSFFIGMLAEQPVTAQLVESRVSSRPAQAKLTRAQSSSSTELAIFTKNVCMEQLLRVFPLPCRFALCGKLCLRQTCQLQVVWLIAFDYVSSCEAFPGHYLYQCAPCFYNNIFAKSFGNNVFFSFGEYVANKLANINAKHESQNPSAAFSFINNNNLVYISFVYPFLGDKLVFHLLLDLSGMGSFSLSR